MIALKCSLARLFSNHRFLCRVVGHVPQFKYIESVIMNAEGYNSVDKTRIQFCMPFYLQGYNLSCFDLNSISVSNCSLLLSLCYRRELAPDSKM